MKEISNIFNNSSFRLSVLGVGTEQGAPIQLVNGELLKDSRGAIVVPKLTANNLKSLSRNSGGRYAPMQTDDSDINFLMEQTLIEQEPNQNEEDRQERFGDKWQEMGPYLLLFILPFAAYSFRRGIITLLCIGVLLPVYSPQAQADWLQDMWKTPDQQAMQAYNKNEYEQAADTFDNSLWQGTAHYKNGDYQAALESFSQIKPTDKDYVDATYNAGNALAQLGEIEQAITTYDRVLTLRPKHQEASANKALLEKLKEQQEQQEQEQEQQESGEPSQEQQDDQQDGQKSEQQQQEEQSQEPQQGEKSEPNESQTENSEQQSQEEAEQEQQQAEQIEDEKQETEQEQQTQALQQGEEELTDEQREQMQRMQNLLKRVPDDPAFLLKRKMQIESQRRKRERLPTNIQGNW
jgi:Ca-activated chloride channel family protein